MNCPNGHGVMPLKTVRKKIAFRDTEITVSSKVHRCPKCKLEAGTIEQTAQLQQAIAEAYRRKVGLLTGADIRALRKKAHITQDELAERTGAGIASIKRWEAGQIQTKSMDQSLRKAFKDPKPENDLTGNREINGVLNQFNNYLEEQLKDKSFAERFEQAGEAWDVALQIAALRRQAGLSKKDLAKALKTSQQQVSRLESPSYEGHSLSMLRRIADVLHTRVRIVFEPVKKKASGLHAAEEATPYYAKRNLAKRP